MDLNNIQLPASLVVSLYRSSLIDSDTEPDTATPIINDTIKSQEKWLGENKKNILIAVDHTGIVHLPDDELSFLTSMLTACRLSLADVVIINRNNYKESGYKELVAQFKSKIIFLFGIEPSSFGLPVTFPHFQVQSFANSKYLFTLTLEEMKKDSLLKSKLWVCLRHIFGV
jgi:hypothetical protein